MYLKSKKSVIKFQEESSCTATCAGCNGGCYVACVTICVFGAEINPI